MRTVEVSRFVGARPSEVEQLLVPQTILDYEGTFTAIDVDETDTGTVVEAQAGGRLVKARFVFEERENGYAYRQDGSTGPFESMETTLTVAPENEGARLTMRSAVSLALPLPLADRVAAWKRRGELNRAVDRLAADVE